MTYPANYFGPANGQRAMTEGEREAWRDQARGGADPSSGYFDSDGNWHLYSGGGGGGGGGGGDDDLYGDVGAIDWERLGLDRERLQLERERMERLGIPELEIRRRLADLQEQQFRSELGLRYLQAAAQLGGPSDWFQAVNFYRGARNQQNVPVFLQSLLNNTSMPAFGAPGSQAPTPQTAQSLIAALGGTASASAAASGASPPSTGTTSTPSAAPSVAPSALPDTSDALNAIRQIHERGAHRLGLGTLENLSPDEAALFASGVRASGGSMPSFLHQYQRSRPQQRASRGTSLGYAA